MEGSAERHVDRVAGAKPQEVRRDLREPCSRRRAGTGHRFGALDRKRRARTAVLERPREQRECGAVRTQQHALTAHEKRFTNARQTRDPGLLLGRKKTGVAHPPCAHVNVGRKHRIEPGLE
jgi:hypothetical protein